MEWCEPGGVDYMGRRQGNRGQTRRFTVFLGDARTDPNPLRKWDRSKPRGTKPDSYQGMPHEHAYHAPQKIPALAAGFSGAGRSAKSLESKSTSASTPLRPPRKDVKQAADIERLSRGSLLYYAGNAQFYRAN